MEELNDYGKIVWRHSGRGRATCGPNVSIEGAFTAVQYVDGRVYLNCTTRFEMQGYDNLNRFLHTFGVDVREDQVSPYRSERAFDFHGDTDSNQLFQIRRMFLFSSTISALHEPRPKLDLLFSCDEAQVKLDISSKVYSAQFALVNFEFHGTEHYHKVYSDGQETRASQLPIDADGTSIIITPARRYSSIINTVRATQSIDVTCAATAELETHDQLAAIVQKMDEVCLVLSAARGTHITWLHYDLLSEDGNVIQSTCRRTVTKRFETDYLIGPDDGWGETTKQFVEGAIRQLPTASSAWNVRQVIETYIDAKLGNDYMRSRGLKMAICTEILKSAFSARQTNKLVIVPKGLFKRVLNDTNKKEQVEAALRKVLAQQDHGSAPNGESSDEVVEGWIQLLMSNFLNLNHYPFRLTLEEMCKEVGLTVTDKELRQVTKIRNLLVHEGRFDPSLDEVKQYQYLNRFIGAFLLAALGYFRHPIWPSYLR